MSQLSSIRRHTHIHSQIAITDPLPHFLKHSHPRLNRPVDNQDVFMDMFLCYHSCAIMYLVLFYFLTLHLLKIKIKMVHHRVMERQSKAPKEFSVEVVIPMMCAANIFPFWSGLGSVWWQVWEDHLRPQAGHLGRGLVLRQPTPRVRQRWQNAQNLGAQACYNIQSIHKISQFDMYEFQIKKNEFVHFVYGYTFCS